MAFSPDSRSFAYTYKEKGKEKAVINEIAGKDYDWIFNPRFFTPDSRYFIYKARQKSLRKVICRHVRQPVI
jgi:hypothetical protein